jgi:hypothetical protein
MKVGFCNSAEMGIFYFRNGFLFLRISLSKILQNSGQNTTLNTRRNNGTTQILIRKVALVGIVIFKGSSPILEAVKKIQGLVFGIFEELAYAIQKNLSSSVINKSLQH